MIKAKKTGLFVDYFEEWVDTYKVGAVRQVTLNKYLMTHQRLREIVPTLKISQLDRRSYQQIINEYAKTHEKQTTTDFHHQVKGCILDLFHDGLLDRDPTYRAIVKGKEPKEKKPKFLHGDELKKLTGTLDIGSEINWDWFILFLAKTGLRYAEGLAVTPNDFDFKENSLKIDKTWNYKYTAGFQPTKNAASVRTIAIDWQLVGQFGPMIKDLDPTEPIFVKKEPNGRYQRVFNSTINYQLEKRCKEAGVPVITVHGLRHTHASILLGAGVTIHSISARLGHSNVTTTQEVYTHIINELEAKDNQKIIGTLMEII